MCSYYDYFCNGFYYHPFQSYVLHQSALTGKASGPVSPYNTLAPESPKESLPIMKAEDGIYPELASLVKQVESSQMGCVSPAGGIKSVGGEF